MIMAVKKTWAQKNPEKSKLIKARYKAKLGPVAVAAYHKNYAATHRRQMNANLAVRRLREDQRERERIYRASRTKIKAEQDRARYVRLGAQIRARSLKWAKEHPAIVAHRVQVRMALKKRAAVNLKSIQAFIYRVKSKNLVRCYYCGDMTPTFGCHFDHIVPLSKGGPHSVENLCATCPSCNCSKQDKALKDWNRIGQQVLPL